MKMSCSAFPRWFWRFSNNKYNYSKLTELLTLNLQCRTSSSTTATPKRKRKNSATSENKTNLQDIFQFQNLPEFHNGNGTDNEGLYVNGLAISKQGKSMLFPLARNEQQKISASFSKTDCTSASVSKILKETMPPDRMLILQRWEKKMIRELGLEGFQSYKQEMLKTGHEFHQYIQDYLALGRLSEVIPDCVNGYWTSIKPVFSDVSEVQLSETSVRHPYLNYHGIVDCVACWRNQLCVIDWKTSRKKKSTLKQTYDYPLQTVAYAGAINFSEEIHNQIRNIAIIIAYEDGSPADVHFLDTDTTEMYWTQWLHRLQEYKELVRATAA